MEGITGFVGQALCRRGPEFGMPAANLIFVRPDFVKRFATPIVRASLPGGAGEQSFFSLVEHEEWRRAREAEGLAPAPTKYFKGLGTSTNKMAKEYFRDLAANSIVVRHTPPPGMERGRRPTLSAFEARARAARASAGADAQSRIPTARARRRVGRQGPGLAGQAPTCSPGDDPIHAVC